MQQSFDSKLKSSISFIRYVAIDTTKLLLFADIVAIVVLFYVAPKGYELILNLLVSG